MAYLPGMESPCVEHVPERCATLHPILSGAKDLLLLLSLLPFFEVVILRGANDLRLYLPFLS
ncbi:MAG TPA: hypothetical protein VFC39_15995 [Acidobacteriaceae bacterium]|nr:hypothetical protein [Acidobacteriaceae bacterium]